MNRRCRSARLLSWILVTVLLMGVPVVASATILDPYEYVSNMSIDGVNDLITVDLPDDFPSWRRYADGELGSVANGNSFSWSGEMRWLDNMVVYFYPFGYGNYFLCEGIPSDTNITGKLKLVFTATNFSQSFDVNEKCYLMTWDENGNKVASHVLSDSDITPTGSGGYTDRFAINAPASYLEGAYAWSLEIAIDYSNVVDEYDTTTITCTYDTSEFALQMSISSLYRLQQETGKTHALLDAVNKQLEENGQTLNDILKQQEANGDKLDQVINGGQAGEDLNVKDDQMSEAGDEINDGLGDIKDFEDIYMGQLEDNLPDIIAAADFSLLAVPLTWVQYWLNRIVGSIPSTYLIVFTLPMLFGLVMFILGHPVRAPRPDTSGDIVTRETFTTSTVLSGRHEGRTSTVRTVTQSREIGRVHGE